jgi:hypothetical protein
MKPCQWLLTCAAVFAVGCAPGPSGVRTGGGKERRLPPSPYLIPRCQLDVGLEPATHRLEAAATLTVAAKGKTPGTEKLRLQLHRDLGIDGVTCDGKAVPYRRLPDAATPTTAPTTCPADDEEEKAPPPAIWELDWTAAAGRPGILVIRYGGALYQDVQAGEKAGAIHNFKMRAHVGAEGVYLGENGVWYPQLPDTGDDEPKEEPPLTSFELTATEIPGMVLVACGNRDGAKLDVPRSPRTTWRMPFPTQGLALVGGPHKVFQREVPRISSDKPATGRSNPQPLPDGRGSDLQSPAPVLVSVHVSEANASFAPGLLDAVESYLRLYQPLLGDYPYVEFTVVENFFSSGFAFPGFTVLASAVIAMGPMGLQPGYLDHEMLHNWWGNGVFVSALDGNWCECLTSYCANYMRPVLEGRADKARAQRRDICYGLSRLLPADDKPLATFGRKDGAKGFIGYQKGSMVFAMLADRIGQDTFWRALRRLYRERLGKLTGWKDIQQAVEAESRQSLGGFFDAWVRGRGAPDLVLDGATYDQRARRVAVTIQQQGEPTFDVRIPVRLVYADGVMDETVEVDRPTQARMVKSLRAPDFVELDPDYRVLHRVPPECVMPTISGLGKSKDLLIVRSNADGKAYDPVVEQMHDRYKKREGGAPAEPRRAEGTAVREVKDAELTADDVKQGHVLLLGKACLAPAAAALLRTPGKPLLWHRPPAGDSTGETQAQRDDSTGETPVPQAVPGVREDGPIEFGDGWFSVDGQRYDQPGQEVLCCVNSPNDPGAVVCYYWGNSAADLKKARVATFYGGNSLVIFENGNAVLRKDFEKPQRVAVDTGP